MHIQIPVISRNIVLKLHPYYEGILAFRCNMVNPALTEVSNIQAIRISMLVHFNGL